MLVLPANLSGVIGFGGDVDVFRFQVVANARVIVTLSLVRPFAKDGAAAVGRGRSNLDTELELLDGSGAVLPAWRNDNGLLEGIFTSDSVATAGTYHLRIRGVGQGQSASAGEQIPLRRCTVGSSD